MIEQDGLVVDVRGEKATILMNACHLSCNSCDTGGCGTKALSGFMAKRSITLEAENGIDARAGDYVVVGVTESAMLKFTLLLYISPLIIMIFFAAMGQWLALRFQMNESIGSLMFGVVGFIMGLFLAKMLIKKMFKTEKYYPVLIKQQSR